MRRSSATIAAVVFSMVGGAAGGHDVAPRQTSTRVATPSELSREARARAYFTDEILVDQNGRGRKFYSELLRDGVVLISFFFAACKDACPLINQRLAGLQDMLADSLGNGVSLLSITVDPEHDTPLALREYAARFGARDGWHFLSGEPRAVRTILRRLGNVAADPAGHLTLFIAGHAGRAEWHKLRPDMPDAVIVERLRLMAQAQGR